MSKPTVQGVRDSELEKARRTSAIMDARLKQLEIETKSSWLLRYLPLAQAGLTLAGFTLAVVIYRQADGPLKRLQAETADWERRANVPRVSPQLNFECSQQALGISDGKARYLCTANLAFENAGAGPFTVDQIIFRLYGGSPCFDLPQMRLAGDGRSPAERWLANAGKAKLPDATGGPSCPHGLNRRIEGAVRIGSPADADADTFWTMLEAVTSDREGFNGISHYERNEHGGASASWFVTVPWLQYAYFAVETELSWSAKTPEGQIKSEPRGTPNLKHSHWYSLVVDKQKFGADVGPGQLSLPPAKSIH